MYKVFIRVIMITRSGFFAWWANTCLANTIKINILTITLSFTFISISSSIVSTNWIIFFIDASALFSHTFSFICYNFSLASCLTRAHICSSADCAYRLVFSFTVTRVERRGWSWTSSTSTQTLICWSDTITSQIAPI